MYGLITNIASKSDEELKKLRGLHIIDLHIGLESGLQSVVKDLHRGGTISQFPSWNYSVERSFLHAKSSVGLDQYQARDWLAWHHHMTMLMMAILFMLETRLAEKDSNPLLSCPDIVTIVTHFLPRRDIVPEEVFRQMSL